MKGFINSFIWIVCWLRHMLPVVWKHSNGGLFCWRDAPLWVVQGMADTPLEPDTDAAIRDLWQQAVDELAMRKRRGEF